MDNASDSTITFDENGNCNYCTKAFAEIGTTTYFPNEEGKLRLEKTIAMLKREGQGKEYDCAMGISGGLDSSYLAYLGYKWGLRIFAVHIDDGYDTEISKKNIAKLVAATGLHLETIAPDAGQYNALTLAYMKAGVPDIAIPQDNILFAFLYKRMRELHIKYFLGGGNFALESILQRGNTYDALDVINIKDIHRHFGTEPIDKLHFVSSWQKYWWQKTGKLDTTLRLLDFIDYNRDRAFVELKEYCGFEYYGRKHLENILTAFIQLYWFPKKFGVDKRRSHLSSMIVSGQMSREDALRELDLPLYDEHQMADYMAIIKERMGLNDAEFDDIIIAPPHRHNEFRTDWLSEILHRIL